MNKDIVYQKFQEKLRNVRLEKEMHEEAILNIEGNVISEILDAIAQFVSKIVTQDDIFMLKLFLVNTDLDTLLANKYARRLPYFSEISHNIYFALAGNRYSFSEMTDDELSVLLSHEYFHFLESPKSLSLEKKIIRNGAEDDGLQTIVSESRADYFSGYFLKHVLRSGVKDKSIITQCENFVFGLSDSISDLQIDIQKRVFYSVDGDVHGTSEHRLEMFHQGLYSGNFEYLQNITNFIPDRIEKIDSKDPKYYGETSKNSRNNLEYHEKV